MDEGDTLNSNWALASLTLSLSPVQFYSIPPKPPVLVFTFWKLLFSLWVCSAAPYPSKEACWHFCPIASLSGCTVCEWRKWSLNAREHPWAPLPSRALSHWAPLGCALKRPKSALLEARAVSLLCALLSVLSISSLSTSWSHYSCWYVLPTKNKIHFTISGCFLVSFLYPRPNILEITWIFTSFPSEFLYNWMNVPCIKINCFSDTFLLPLAAYFPSYQA